MKAPKLERQLKDKLSDVGIEIKPGTTASRTLKQIARVSTDVANSGEEALRVARTTIEEAADAARSAIHAATAPRPSGSSAKPTDKKPPRRKP